MNQLNESEVPLSQMLQTLTSSSWQQQIQIITSLKVNPQLIKLINHRNYSAELASLFASHNPRTKLITALSEFLIELFSNYSNQLIGFANLLISNECLVRLLGSGNKVISSSANQIMKCIISNVDFRAKGKHIKFVTNLEHQFLNSRNGYVREKISLYFLLISTSFYYNTRQSLAEFQRKIVKQGLEDANEKVRTNMKQILQNIYHFQKENELASVQQKVLTRKSTDKSPLKLSKAKVYRQNKSLKALNTSSMNQSSILQHFGQQDKSQRRLETVSNTQTSEQSYRFYLQQLKSTSTWAMISIAYQSLVEMIKKGYLAKQGTEQLYCQTIKALTPFLNQKRSKICQSCGLVYKVLLQQILINKREKVINFCQEHTVWIIQHLIKNQNTQLIKTFVALNPSYFLPKVAEISVGLKIHRQKLLLLDAIVVNLQSIFQEGIKTKGNKRVGAIVRAMCQHIELTTLKEKEVSLAALAIISQLKQRYPQQVLTALLCQNDRTLTKILEVAESIDPSLKQAIIDYINSLKGSNRKNSQRQLISQRKNLSQIINKEMLLIVQNKTGNLNRLGEIVLTHLDGMDCKQFVTLLSLLQFLCTADLIVEYKILMEQISKLSNKEFTNAIIQLLTAQIQGQQAKARQHHDILLLELLSTTLKVNPREHGSAISKCLVHVYRNSDWSAKKRSIAIELLSRVSEQTVQRQVNESEKLLIETYKQTIEEDEWITN